MLACTFTTDYVQPSQLTGNYLLIPLNDNDIYQPIFSSYITINQMLLLSLLLLVIEILVGGFICYTQT